MRMLGDLTGRALLTFGEYDATRLCDLILRRPPGPPRALGELEQSGLKEVGNIVCSAYLTALSNFMGMMLLPSVPALTIGPTGAGDRVDRGSRRGRQATWCSASTPRSAPKGPRVRSRERSC